MPTNNEVRAGLPPTHVPGLRDAIVHTPAHVGSGLRIKGQIIGNEDLKIDGEVEGPISLAGHRLTVGANSRVRGQIVAREVVVYGDVTGEIQAAERIEVKKHASVLGVLTTPRITIEEGAHFKGAIEVERSTGAQPSPDPNALLALAEKEFKMKSIRSAGQSDEDSLKA
jgi:cytoskeletal protein CcmA (bactofilin family)